MAYVRAALTSAASRERAYRTEARQLNCGEGRGMQIFLDTAYIGGIERGIATGCVSGITTNPTIISREHKSLQQCVAEIVALDPTLILLIEPVGTDREDLTAQACHLAGMAPNVVVKLPMTREGLGAVRLVTGEGVRTAVTLVFSLNQAIAASCAGADFVAPFVGRLDDIDAGGLDVVRAIKETFRAQGAETQVIAASLRTPQAVGELFSVGCDIVTMPVGILDAMLQHPLTEAGLTRFAQDWAKVPGGLSPRAGEEQESSEAGPRSAGEGRSSGAACQ